MRDFVKHGAQVVEDHVHVYLRTYAETQGVGAEDPSTITFVVRVVWFCKTLQNWKGIFITDLPDNILYEVTYNGDKNETYLDVYEKVENVLLKHPEHPVHDN